jgi:hypothetical protein
MHPTFDPQTQTWFVDKYEATTLAELKTLLPKRTTIIGYYPRGFGFIGYSPGPPIRKPFISLKPGFAVNRSLPPAKIKNGYNHVAMNFNAAPWTDEETKQCKILYKTGHSCGEIGRKLNRSRSAIAGKIHREKWSRT